MADQKKYFRTMLGECRASLTPEFARAASLVIQRRLLADARYRSARTIVLYSPVQNEVATAMLATDAIASGRAVFYPRLAADRTTIALARVRDLSELVPGVFGIPAPAPDCEFIAPDDLAGAIVTVPGLVFGVNGQRLGRGGGHYDRFLAALPREAITVGLAYSFQLLDWVPEEPFDRRLQYIITESALIRASEPAVWMPETEADRGGTPG